MRFEHVLARWNRRELSRAEAGELLGMGERTFRRWRDRHEDEGLAGLYDRRLGKASAKRVPADEIERVPSLYRDRYCGFTVKHFHEKLEKDHDFRFGYTWTKTTLQGAGLVKKAPRRGAHREASGPGGRCRACWCIRTARATAGYRISIGALI